MTNSFFCYCNKDGVGLGSDPHFGLFIEENLQSGSSHKCLTYSNEALSSKEHFSIKKLEVFAFKHNFQ